MPPKSMKKPQHRDREQQHLGGLGDQQHQDQVPALVARDVAVAVRARSRRRSLSSSSPTGCSIGVDRVAATDEVDVDEVVDPVHLLGQPDQQEADRDRARTAAASATAREPSRVAESCQTSALMKRNVMKSSSSGSARVTIGSSCRRLPRVRRRAHARIGRARRAVTA